MTIFQKIKKVLTDESTKWIVMTYIVFLMINPYQNWEKVTTAAFFIASFYFITTLIRRLFFKTRGLLFGTAFWAVIFLLILFFFKIMEAL